MASGSDLEEYILWLSQHAARVKGKGEREKKPGQPAFIQLQKGVGPLQKKVEGGVSGKGGREVRKRRGTLVSKGEFKLNQHEHNELFG